ncbi:hypothetical protein [Nocardioides pocheonensis]|uniref:Uncharacterized protein n=1 Tax=Nocardioides pocheonensis TaxID=661485 RepID=A0A3N0GVV6_9ACTN|nr:hypothetical protein [Nocardioides pocheonensis]RNM16593.1 hypothetical protein EFL26_03385 [Nocardioides pocheonensis]
MDDDIHPISPPPGTVPAGWAAYQPPRRRRIGLAVAALALVAGGTAGGITVGANLGSGEHETGFSTQTSQAFTGGQEEPAEAEQPAPAPAHTGEGGGDD